MLRIRRLRDHLLDLFAAQNRGECLPLARRRDRERRAVTLQRGVKEKAQPVRHDIAGTPRTADDRAAGGRDRPALRRQKSDRAAADRTGRVPSPPTDTIHACGRRTHAPPCRRPSVGATRSSHTSVSRRAEPRGSDASIGAIVCVLTIEERDSRIRQDNYRDQRFRSTMSRPTGISRPAQRGSQHISRWAASKNVCNFIRSQALIGRSSRP